MSDDRTTSIDYGLSNIPVNEDHRPMSWYQQNWYPQPPPIPVPVPVSIVSQRDNDALLKRIAELELRVRRIEDVQRLGKRR